MRTRSEGIVKTSPIIFSFVLNSFAALKIPRTANPANQHQEQQQEQQLDQEQQQDQDQDQNQDYDQEQEQQQDQDQDKEQEQEQEKKKKSGKYNKIDLMNEKSKFIPVFNLLKRNMNSFEADVDFNTNTFYIKLKCHNARKLLEGYIKSNVKLSCHM